MRESLSSITLHVYMEGETWRGFTAEREVGDVYFPPGKGRYAACTMPNVWPSLKVAVAQLCADWDDVQRETVRPFYVQLRWNLRAEDGGKVWTRHVVREFDEADLARLGVR